MMQETETVGVEEGYSFTNRASEDPVVHLSSGTPGAQRAFRVGVVVEGRGAFGTGHDRGNMLPAMGHATTFAEDCGVHRVRSVVRQAISDTTHLEVGLCSIGEELRGNGVY
jgi:hypothetical protein